MNSHFIDTRLGFNEVVTVFFERYAGKGNTRSDSVAIILEDTQGMTWLTPSVNIDGVTGGRVVAIKNHSEGEGIDKLLIENGIINPLRNGTVSTGHVHIPLYTLTDEAAQAAGLDERIAA